MSWQSRLSHLIAAGSLAWVSIQLYRTWVDPLAIENGAWVKFGVGLILLEFVFVHSSPFMGFIAGIAQRGRRMAAFLGAAAFYGLFAAAMIFSVNEPRLAWVYFGVMAGRTWAGWADARDEMDLMAGATWALSVVMYLGCVFASVMVDWPHLGLPPELGSKILGSGGDGVWEAEPHRAIAAGAVYFAALALLEAFRALKLRRVPSGQTETP